MSDSIKNLSDDQRVELLAAHYKAILEILGGLDLRGCCLHTVSLVCGEEELKNRLEKDVAAGRRTKDVIGRSAAYLGLYEKLDTEKLDVTGLSAEETAEKIVQMARKGGRQ